MKKAFGIIDILITVFCISVVVAILYSLNSPLDQQTNIVEQKRQVEEAIDQVTDIRNQSLEANQKLYDGLKE